MSNPYGTLVLFGGEARGHEDLGRTLLEIAGGSRVAIVPMASAFTHPEETTIVVAGWLEALGAEVEGVMALSRTEADVEDLAARLDDADLIFVTDGSALHLRTTLKATALSTHLFAALESGRVVAASGAGATVFCDPMVDPRGGAPTVGLGPITTFTVVAHVGDDPDDVHLDKLHRTIELAPKDLPVVALPMRTGIVCRPDGTYEVIGDGHVTVYLGGQAVEAGIAALPSWR